MEFIYATDTFKSIQIKQEQTENKDIHFIENQFVCHGKDGTVWVSSDGVLWKKHESNKGEMKNEREGTCS